MAIPTMTIAPATGAPTPGGQALGHGAGIAHGVYTARLHTSLDTVMPLWLRCQAEGVCTAHQSYAWVEGIAKRLMPEGAELLAGDEESRLAMGWPLLRFRQIQGGGAYSIELAGHRFTNSLKTRG